MLVLSRKAGEAIMIGDDVEIHVTRIDSDAVKLAVKAPRELSIYRHEIYRQIRDTNLSAARHVTDSLPALAKLRLPTKTDTL